MLRIFSKKLNRTDIWLKNLQLCINSLENFNTILIHTYIINIKFYTHWFLI